MSIQLSPQIRVFALVGVLSIVLGGGALLFLHRSKPGTATVPASTGQPTTLPASTTASTVPAGTEASTAATSTVGTTATTAHHAAATAHSQVHPVKLDPNLPAPLRAALEARRVVVVGLYDPRARVDAIALGEVRAGAAAAHVGFLQVNLLENRVAGPLTALLPAGDLLPDPGFLVYRRPGTLVYRFDGYLDRSAIVQAVEAAK